jgi:hypothetical protein
VIVLSSSAVLAGVSGVTRVESWGWGEVLVVAGGALLPLRIVIEGILFLIAEVIF